MAKTKTKRKYTKKNPTPTEKLAELQSNYDGLMSRNAALSDILKHKEAQCNNLSNLVDNQHAEIAMLRERSLTLIEAVEVIARASRLNKQQEHLSQFNRTVNEQCEAGYAHGYEKQR